MNEKQYLSLISAAQRCPSRPSANAIWRWCRRGVLARSGQRVHLKHYRIGGKLFTTDADLQHFFGALAKADQAYFDKTSGTSPIIPAKGSARQRETQFQQAEQVLADDGI